MSCQGHLVSSVVLLLICLILKGKQRSFGVWRGLMVVIRHRLSHQQGWTLMSKGKGLMPTKKWLSHSFSLCQLWFLAMSISKHLYMCALKILKVLLCLNRITFSFYFHLPDKITTHPETRHLYWLKLCDSHQAFIISHSTFLLCFMHPGESQICCVDKEALMLENNSWCTCDDRAVKWVGSLLLRRNIIWLGSQNHRK